MFSSLLFIGLCTGLSWGLFAFAQPQLAHSGVFTSPIAGPGKTMLTNLQRGYADPNVEDNKNLERSNTSANPIPTDTTLRTGRSWRIKQSQEEKKEAMKLRSEEQKFNKNQ